MHTIRHPDRPLSDDLAGRTAEELAQLMALRPDLSRPRAHSLVALAARAVTPTSMRRAVAGLTRGELAVLRAVLHGAGDESAVRDALSAADREKSVAPILARLRELALIWRNAPDGTGPYAAALGLEHVLPDDTEPPDTLITPQAMTTAHPPRRVDDAGGAAAAMLVEHVDELLTAWMTQPVPVLRKGGLSQRHLAQVATHLTLDVGATGLVLELAMTTGLIALDPKRELYMATTAAELWRIRPVERRWAALAWHWLTSVRAPWLIGTGVNALSVDAQSPVGRAVRLDVLRALAALPPGHGASTDELTAVLDHAAPLSGATPETVAAALREGTWLGLVAHDALTSVGHTALDCLTDSTPGDEALLRLATGIAPHYPAAATAVIVQGDMTVLVPGRLAGDLRVLIEAATEQESRGVASVRRFTPRSIAAALRSGWTADALTQALRSASSTELPQALTFLITDTARQHAQLRIGSAGSYLRSDDDAHLSRVLAEPRLSAAGLRRLAAGVLVSPLDPASLAELLHDAGEGAVIEGADGSLSTITPPRHLTSATTGRARPVTVRDSVPIETLRELAEQLLAEASADHTEPAPATARAAVRGTAVPAGPVPRTDPVVSWELLTRAIAAEQQVRLGFTNELGSLKSVVFTPRRITGGRVHGLVDGSRLSRAFLLSRVTGVELLGTEPGADSSS